MSEVHRQAKPTLLVAAAFAVAAAVATVVPHRSGWWLPLHLFLVGGLLSAISASTQLLAVTWSASPAPRLALARTQRWLLAVGAAALVLSRELGLASVVTASAGGLVLVSLVLLAGLLLQIRRRAVVPRFRSAIDGYLVAVALGVVGSSAGVAMVAGATMPSYAGVRAAHLTVNLFGLVGVVIAATLPYFAAVQARTKQSPRATPAAVRSTVGWLGACVAAAAAGHLVDLRVLVVVGMAGFAGGLVVVGALLPRLGRKQLDWAGPRLLQLGAGLWWWAVAAILFATAEPGRTSHVAVTVLVVGGYGQILSASLAYFGPVLRGGGHVALTAGFALTRSWLALATANVAAVAALVDLQPVLVTAIVIWVLDMVVRGLRLARPHRGSADGGG